MHASFLARLRSLLRPALRLRLRGYSTTYLARLSRARGRGLGVKYVAGLCVVASCSTTTYSPARSHTPRRVPFPCVLADDTRANARRFDSFSVPPRFLYIPLFSFFSFLFFFLSRSSFSLFRVFLARCISQTSHVPDARALDPIVVRSFLLGRVLSAAISPGAAIFQDSRHSTNREGTRGSTKGGRGRSDGSLLGHLSFTDRRVSRAKTSARFLAALPPMSLRLHAWVVVVVATAGARGVEVLLSSSRERDGSYLSRQWTDDLLSARPTERLCRRCALGEFALIADFPVSLRFFVGRAVARAACGSSRAYVRSRIRAPAVFVANSTLDLIGASADGSTSETHIGLPPPRGGNKTNVNRRAWKINAEARLERLTHYCCSEKSTAFFVIFNFRLRSQLTVFVIMKTDQVTRRIEFLTFANELTGL